MKILILSQNYIPEPDPKMHILAKGLVERQHDVTVLTGFPNYPQGKIYTGYKQSLFKKEKIDGVKVIRLPLYPDRSNSVVRRSLNYLSFPLSASILGPWLCERADVMFVYHPPITLGIPAWIISLLKKAPFVFEIQDMWPETLPATGMVSSSLILKCLTKLAEFTYSKASAITVISPGFKKNLISKGVLSEKIHIFYNWAYEGNFSLPAPDAHLAKRLNLDGRFNILYAGNMGPAQGLHNVIEAAAMLTDLKSLQFVFLGSGIDHEKLEKMVENKKLSNVRFLPRQPMEMMPSIYGIVDTLMIHLTDDPLFEITVPGKTQSCLLAGKPIIAAVNGDAADLVLRAKAGLTVRAMDSKDLAQAVRKLYAMPPEKRKTMGSNGRAYYFQHLCPEVQIEKYEIFLQQIAGKSR